MDGSCNGLQHYAAIGRDSSGGRKVNLADSPKPGDVYTAVLELVKGKVACESRPEYKEIARLVYPHLQRKVVKQTVMTSVYGVMFIGARTQIQRQLKDLNAFHDDKLLFKASSYLAHCTLEAIGNLFADADRIRDWFKSTAKSVASHNRPMAWESPIGYCDAARNIDSPSSSHTPSKRQRRSVRGTRE